MPPVRSRTTTCSRGARNQHFASPARARGRRRSRIQEPAQTRTFPAIVNVAGPPSPGTSASRELSMPNTCTIIPVHTAQNDASASKGDLTSFPPHYSRLLISRLLPQGPPNVVDYQPHTSESSFDTISVHVPSKIKQKIWKGKFIGLYILLKFAWDLAEDELHGQIQIRNGTMCLIKNKSCIFLSIEKWTSAFLIFTCLAKC